MTYPTENNSLYPVHPPIPKMVCGDCRSRVSIPDTLCHRCGNTRLIDAPQVSAAQVVMLDTPVNLTVIGIDGSGWVSSYRSKESLVILASWVRSGHLRAWVTA